jgi:hypothetical protein
MTFIREDGARATAREPGDLPSAVVTRETRRAGCPDGCRSAALEVAAQALFAVTCHCRPEVLGPCFVPLCHGDAALPLRRLHSLFRG